MEHLLGGMFCKKMESSSLFGSKELPCASNNLTNSTTHAPLHEFWKQEIFPWRNLTSYREVKYLSFIQRTERTQRKYQVYEQVSHSSVLLCPEQTSLVNQKLSFLMNPDSASGSFSTSCSWKPLLTSLGCAFTEQTFACILSQYVCWQLCERCT